MSGRWYWWTLAGLTLVLVLSVSGIVAVWLSPESLPPKYLVVPKLTDPKFTLQRHLLVDAASGKWEWTEEEVIPPATGRKLLTLLRGSPTWAAVWDEYHHQHPEEPVMLRHFDHTLYFSLAAYESDSPHPKLTVAFESDNRVWVNRELYVVRQSRLSELRDELATLEDETVMGNATE